MTYTASFPPENSSRSDIQSSAMHLDRPDLVMPCPRRQQPQPGLCLSPHQRAALLSQSSPQMVSPNQPSHLMDMVSMEEMIASRIAARIALARLEAASRQRQEQERVATFLSLQQQQQQQPRIVSPIKQPLQPLQGQRFQSAPPVPGLDLLHTAATSIGSSSSALSPGQSSSSSVSEAPLPTPNENVNANEGIKKVGGRLYIDAIQETDILCGRGGRSNHHNGNKRYRQVVSFMKFRYQKCPAKTQKTDLARKIVEYCCSYGARFIKKDNETEQYYVLTKDEARKKTSQALRETKAIKWTA